VQELIPEEGAGLVREMGYAHLPVGRYVTNLELVPEDQRAGLQTEYHEDEEFQVLLERFRHAVDSRSEEEVDFNNAWGILEISQEQPHLRRIHWEVNYLTDTGEPGQFQRSFWIHEYSLYWEQYGLRDFSYLGQYEDVNGRLLRTK
jgi:hypothetical protein